ncbi:hypothetical protein [Salipiger marinus]|uniref:Uncharacterized protein n=1 Tax=Salipiger marinus TaxID=555512 RepID=A0A1G8PVE7_9RHOB|nr:hypothetical protein [Salipiger marinus]SDI96403.1 hypothetical protein SAMN04487993_1013140 [Salipiger marinus]
MNSPLYRTAPILTSVSKRRRAVERATFQFYERVQKAKSDAERLAELERHLRRIGKLIHPPPSN